MFFILAVYLAAALRISWVLFKIQDNLKRINTKSLDSVYFRGILKRGK